MDPSSCYVAALSRLTEGDLCIRRVSFTPEGQQPLLPQLPLYVLSVPTLVKRAQRIRERLAAARAHDVTWIMCANRDDIGRLDASTQAEGSVYEELRVNSSLR